MKTLLQKTITLFVSKKQVEIKEGDGYSERILLKKNKKVYEVIPEYLASLVVSIDGKTKITANDILDLLTPDQEWLAIECYKLNYGDMLDFSFTCPNCGKTEDKGIDLSKLEIIPSIIDSVDPTLTIELPRSKQSAVVGLLNGHKEKLLLELQAKTGTLDPNQADFLCLRELNGSKEFSYEDIVNLPLIDHKMIRQTRRKLVCGYDTTVSVVCSICEGKTLINILTHKDFLLPGA